MHVFLWMDSAVPILTLVKSNISTSYTTVEDGGIIERSCFTSELPNPYSGEIVNVAHSPFFIVVAARSNPIITCSTNNKHGISTDDSQLLYKYIL